MEIAVEVGAEDNSLLGDAAQAAETEDLVAAGVGEDGARPGHEAMESAKPLDEIGSGAEVEVIGVGEDDLRVEVGFEVALGEAFDGGLCADRHEGGRFDDAVGSVKQARAGAGDGAFSDDFETDLWHYAGGGCSGGSLRMMPSTT